jgi:hypothetical protein
MTVVKKTLDRMLVETRWYKFCKNDLIIPKKIKSAHKNIWKRVLEDLGYKTFLLEELGSITKNKTTSFVIGWAIENAILRGNKNNPEAPVLVNYYLGDYGIVAKVEDFGDGFDYNETQRRFLSGEGYALNNGAGFIGYNYDDVEVSFSGKGNIVNIMHKGKINLLTPSFL